jgi:hypothetical protein
VRSLLGATLTFGTLAVQVWPVTDVQAYLGHADIKTTMRYVHHAPKHDAAERFSRFVQGQLGVSEQPNVRGREHDLAHRTRRVTGGR